MKYLTFVQNNRYLRITQYRRETYSNTWFPEWPVSGTEPRDMQIRCKLSAQSRATAEQCFRERGWVSICKDGSQGGNGCKGISRCFLAPRAAATLTGRLQTPQEKQCT